MLMNNILFAVLPIGAAVFFHWRGRTDNLDRGSAIYFVVSFVQGLALASFYYDKSLPVPTFAWVATFAAGSSGSMLKPLMSAPGGRIVR